MAILTYDAWKWFKDAVDDYVITGGGDLLAAASQIELPFIGPLLVKLAAAGLGYVIDELIDLIPHDDEGTDGDDSIEYPLIFPMAGASDEKDEDEEPILPPVNSKEMMELVINKKIAPMIPLEPQRLVPRAIIQAPFGTGAVINTTARDINLPIIEHTDKLMSKNSESKTRPFVDVGGPFVGYTQPGFNPNRSQYNFNHDLLSSMINKYPTGQTAGLHTV